MSYLILIRHGLTNWNKIGKWHGISDIPLNKEGKEQAKLTADAIKDIQIDLSFTSVLERTKQTSQIICTRLGKSCPVFADKALNERDYGIYTGKNKWEVKKEIGDEKFEKLRRGWDVNIPEGESLKDVYNRVTLFYQQKILPELKKGKNVMVVSSGNTLRALVKYLEKISDEEISSFEINFGEVIVYKLSMEGEIISKETRAKNLYEGKR